MSGTEEGRDRARRLVMELPVAATWPDGKVTVSINGTRFTFTEDNPQIREVLKKATDKARRPGARKRLGSWEGRR